jgi:hypothetical protein
MSEFGGSAPRAESRGTPLPTEKVAYWFFRLNGCLTMENFIVHADFADGVPNVRTEADIIGVRFPERLEDLTKPMKDHQKLMVEGHRPLLFFAEVTLNQCKLNGPWTDPGRGNMERVLRSIGMHSENEIAEVSRALYRDCRFSAPSSEVRLFAVGDKTTGMATTYPGAISLTWREMLAFIHSRFRAYHRQKRLNSQWDSVGRRLFRMAVNEPSQDTFVENARLLLANSNHDRLPA